MCKIINLNTSHYTRQALRDTFEKFGTVNDVVLGGLVQGGAQHVAHVVYEDSRSNLQLWWLHTDLNADFRSVNKVENTGTLSFDFDTSHTKTGLDKWLAECQEENQVCLRISMSPDAFSMQVEPKELLALADGQISNYDAAVQALHNLVHTIYIAIYIVSYHWQALEEARVAAMNQALLFTLILT